LAIIDNRKNNALARRGAETALGNQQKAVYLNRATALILVAVGLYAVHVGIVVGIGLFIIGCGLFMINPEYVNNYLKDFIKTVGGVTNDKNNNSRD